MNSFLEKLKNELFKYHNVDEDKKWSNSAFDLAWEIGHETVASVLEVHI